MLKDRLNPLYPWSGWIGGPVGWLLMHQGLGDAIYFDCRNGNPAMALLFGVAALAIALGGGWMSWTAHKGKGEAGELTPTTRSFVGLVGVMIGAIAAVAIVLQVAAGLILPGCYG